MPMTAAERAEIKRWREDHLLLFDGYLRVSADDDGRVHLEYPPPLMTRRTFTVTTQGGV